MRRLPVSAGLFLAGFLAITGSPPFGPFISELLILIATVEAHRYLVAGAYALLLVTVFIAMGRTVLAVVQGEPPAEEPEATPWRESLTTTLPIAASLAVVVMMGIWIPEPLKHLVLEAVRLLRI
jgi:hydrogenase-4 component F